LNLQWDLFAGGRHTYQVKQAQADVESGRLRFDYTRDELELQFSRTVNNYKTALASYRSAKTQLSLAGKYYNDQLKVYKEGQLLYIELLDAQNGFTLAALQRAVALSNVLIAAAELERCQASYPL
jgi:outer membrane protein TolC